MVHPVAIPLLGIATIAAPLIAAAARVAASAGTTAVAHHPAGATTAGLEVVTRALLARATVATVATASVAKAVAARIGIATEEAGTTTAPGEGAIDEERGRICRICKAALLI